MFKSVGEAARYLSAQASKSLWAAYDAAVSTGLAGDVTAATRLFLLTSLARAKALSMHLPDVRGFHAAVTVVVNEARELHKLPKLSEIGYA